MKILRFSIVFIFSIFFINWVPAQDGATILKKMDQTMMAVKDKTVDVKMVLLNQKSQKEKTKEAVLMQKGIDKKLFRYTAPPSDSGIATLSLPNSEIYLYLPMFKKPKKITNIAESNAFNKSDFSIEDMSTQSYSERFNAKLVNTTETSFVLDLLPKDPSASQDRQVIHVNKKYYYPEKIEYYDKKGEHIKTALYKQKKIGNYWVAESVSMEDLKKQHKTTLYMSNFKINQGISDDEFTLEKLAPSN